MTAPPRRQQFGRVLEGQHATAEDVYRRTGGDATAGPQPFVEEPAAGCDCPCEAISLSLPGFAYTATAPVSPLTGSDVLKQCGDIGWVDSCSGSGAVIAHDGWYQLSVYGAAYTAAAVTLDDYVAVFAGDFGLGLGVSAQVPYLGTGHNAIGGDSIGIWLPAGAVIGGFFSATRNADAASLYLSVVAVGSLCLCDGEPE